ncbi:conserved hypothetical protein [Yersinia pestis Angola]|nr:conserved hypothetical protein [Yersinia pestis Angola]
MPEDIYFVRRAWRVVLRCDVNLTDLPDLYLSTCPCWMI